MPLFSADAPPAAKAGPAATESPAVSERLAALEAEVAELRRELDALKARA